MYTTRAHRNSPNAKQPPSRPRLGPQGATRDGNERGVRVLCLGLEPRCDAVHPEVVLRYILKPSLRHPHHNRYTQWPCPCYRVVRAYFVSVAPHPPPVKVVPQLFVLLFPPQPPTKGDRRGRPSTGGCSRQCESSWPASNCHHDDVIRGPEISHLKAALLLFPAHICSRRGMPTDLRTSLPRGVDVEVGGLLPESPPPPAGFAYKTSPVWKVDST